MLEDQVLHKQIKLLCIPISMTHRNNSPSSVNLMDSELQAIMVALVLLRTSRGTGMNSLYLPPDVGTIVTPLVEFVRGIGLDPEPATSKVKESTLHLMQAEIS